MAQASTRTLVAGLLIQTFLVALFLSLAPQIHLRLHSDAQQSQHQCAVTLIAGGNCDHAGCASELNAPVAPNQFSALPTLASTWVASPFLGARIFEHAPPARS